MEAALVSGITELALSTDSEEIARACPDVWTLWRGEDISSDEAPMLPVIEHAVAQSAADFDAVVILQPTSPLRSTEDIDRCVAMLEAGESVVSVTAGIHPVKLYAADGRPLAGGLPYDKHRYRCWVRNGAVFALRMNVLRLGPLWMDEPLLYCMPKTRSVDIDDPEDLEIARALVGAGVLA